MSLDDLEKKLYDPESGIEKREHEASQFDPVVSSQADPGKLKEEKEWIPEKIHKMNKEKLIKIGGIALGSILLIALIVVAFVLFRRSAFKQQNVTVEIQGPEEITNTGEVGYQIIFKNNNRVDLNNAEILLNYSENFKPTESGSIRFENPSNSRITIGTVKAHSEGRAELRGNFFAVKNSIIYLNATLQFKPENINSVFQIRKQFGVNIGSSPLLLEIEAPKEAADGNKIDYIVHYRNSSNKNLENLRLKLEYPEEFSFISSSTSPSENNNIWYLGNLSPDETGRLVISGKIKGEPGENKLIKAFLGYVGDSGGFTIYDQKEETTQIVSSVLSISQSVDKKTELNVNPGESLKYLINYRNNSDVAVKDAVITMEMEGRIFDFSKLETDGSFDSSKKIITWKAAEIPELANLEPGKEGQVIFSIPILDRIPVTSAEDKNFSVVTTAKIDSPSISTPVESNKVIASDRLELKLNSRVVLDVKGYYKDENIENFGMLPPKVGQETSYTLHWKIINVSNNVTDAKVICSLPSGIKWTGKIYPEGETINFNERTNQIEWNLGVLKNGAGISEPAREISFQVSITPQINQVGSEPKLLNSIVLTGKDAFTNVDVKAEVKEKTINLPEDKSLDWSKFRVVN